MKASEMIQRLQDLIDEHGDMEIVGGTLMDDRSPRGVVALADYGGEPREGETASGFFIQ